MQANRIVYQFLTTSMYATDVGLMTEARVRYLARFCDNRDASICVGKLGSFQLRHMTPESGRGFAASFQMIVFA